MNTVSRKAAKQTQNTNLVWIGAALFIAASVAELVLKRMYPYAVAYKQEPVYRYMLILIGVWWTGLILICAGVEFYSN